MTQALYAHMNLKKRMREKGMGEVVKLYKGLILNGRNCDIEMSFKEFIVVTRRNKTQKS
jgi:hypothetical protein